MAEVYCKADIVYVPGRGGMIISEAMAFACPVILHEADGTEYDLVINGKTGFRIKKDAEAVANKVK